MIVNGIKVQEHFIPVTNKTSRPGIKMVPSYITIHNTGNSAPGATAKMHTQWIDRHPDYLSWHFTVDDKEIYQELPCDEIGYHAGKKTGNDTSIGIEICEIGDYAKAEENAIALVVELMRLYKIPISKVVPHQFWSGKYCPHIILDNGWGKFIARIRLREAVQYLNTKTGIDVKLWSGTNATLKAKWVDALLIKIANAWRVE
jgi:N-acetylmuramoyl-L-alanine amidase